MLTLDVGIQVTDRCLLGGEIGLGGVQGGLVIAVIQRGQDLAFLDHFVVFHQHLVDLARDACGHHHAIGAHIGIVGGFAAIVALPVEARVGRDQQERQNAQQ